MTASLVGPNDPPLKGSAFEVRQEQWKRPVLASVLSFFFAGLGQLYNRQLKKAVLFSMVGPSIDLAGGKLGVFHTFTGLALMVVFSVGWKIVVVADAFLVARREIAAGPPVPIQRAKSIPVLALTVVPFFLYGVCRDFFFDHIAQARAYRIPSSSNCPTVCEGERMVTDTAAYADHEPQRGDLVMFKHVQFDALLFKRVVAIGGDVVNQSPDGILVNGKPASLLDFSQVCGDPPKPERAYFPIEPRTMTVPPDSFYVVGDNLSSSLDSRMQEFGFVRIEELRGRPLFIYWSPYKNRIGCRLR